MQGLSDIYNFSNGAQKPLQQSIPVTKDTLVFRGKLLYQRGKMLGEGAYAKVGMRSTSGVADGGCNLAIHAVGSPPVYVGCLDVLCCAVLSVGL